MFLTALIFFILLMAIPTLIISRSKMKEMKKLKVFIALIIATLALSIYLTLKIFLEVVWYHYAVTPNVAERGMIFKDKLVLSEHKLIGSSDYGMFEIDKYSRSDRQNEVINVVVNKNKIKN